MLLSMNHSPTMNGGAPGWRYFRIAFALATCFALLGLAYHFGSDSRQNVNMNRLPDRDSAGAGMPCSPHAHVRYARGFTLEYHDSYKQVQVLSPWRDARTTFTYILVPRGGRIPPVQPGTMVVEVPVKSMAASTTSCIPFLPMLDLTRSLTGFAGCDRVNTPAIVEMIRQRQITEIGVGTGGMVMALNMERLYALRPDIVMIYGTGLPEYDHHPKLLEAGFKPVMFASYMENSPLGRTEWIKFFAAFFDREAEAERLFDEIAERYEALAAKTRDAVHRPTVFNGIPHRGLMWVPGGRSYVAGFLADAGADYMWWDDATSGSMPLSVESVLERAGKADFWLDPGASRSLSELAGVDERFGLFKAFRTGNVFNNDARTGPNGGNDYWETGEANPDLVLRDLISIFHPEVLPSYRPTWYRRLPEQTEGLK